MRRLHGLGHTSRRLPWQSPTLRGFRRGDPCIVDVGRGRVGERVYGTRRGSRGSVVGGEQDATHHLTSSPTLGPPSWLTMALISSISLSVPRLMRC